MAAIAALTFSVPAMADTVTVQKRVYTQERGEVRPGITISDRGVAISTYRERDRERCVTKSVTKDNGERSVTKTVKRCR
jgi:hypothetical protein